MGRALLRGEQALRYAERHSMLVQIANVKGVEPARARELLAKVQLRERAPFAHSIWIVVPCSKSGMATTCR